MSTIYQRTVPTAIMMAEDAYQEILRGTEPEALVPSLVARASFYGMNEVGCYFNAYTYNRILSGLALCWAVCSYKSLQERTWLSDWAVLTFKLPAESIVDYMTGYYFEQTAGRVFHDTKYVSKKNNERLHV